MHSLCLFYLCLCIKRGFEGKILQNTDDDHSYVGEDHSYVGEDHSYVDDDHSYVHA